MQRKSMGKNILNPRGYFEDVRWQAVNKAWTGSNYTLRLTEPSDTIIKRYRKLAKAYQTDRLWGMKSPRLCWIARFLWPLLEDVRVVAVRRDFDATVRSLITHSRIAYNRKRTLSDKDALALLTRWRDARDETLALWGGPMIEVQFEELLAHPLREAERLCAFASAGTGVDLDPEAGARFVDPELNHDGHHPKEKAQ